MARFYGVYLNNTAISTVLDIIRFLGEPDAIRFSHITLRGPYADSGLAKARLQEINDRYQRGQRVTMIEPANFFSERQFTVVVAVDLQDLKDLFYKPDFPDGIPHLTLYDGNSRGFAEAVFAIARKYVWGFSTGVGPLRAIESKRHLDREFLPFFTSFCSLFQKLIGDPATINAVRSFSADHRLDLIQVCF